MRKILLIILALACGAMAIDTTNTWNAVVDGSWQTGILWDQLVVPTANHNVVLDGTVSKKRPTANANIYAKSVTFKNANGVMNGNGYDWYINDSLSFFGLDSCWLGAGTVRFLNNNALLRIVSASAYMGISTTYLSVSGSNTQIISAHSTPFVNYNLLDGSSLSLIGSGTWGNGYINSTMNFITLGNGCKFTSSAGAMTALSVATVTAFSLGTNDTIAGTAQWNFTSRGGGKWIFPTLYYLGTGPWFFYSDAAGGGLNKFTGHLNLGTAAMYLRNVAAVICRDSFPVGGSFRCGYFEWNGLAAGSQIKLYFGISKDTMTSWNSVAVYSALDTAWLQGSTQNISGSFTDDPAHGLLLNSSTFIFDGTTITNFTSSARKFYKIIVQGTNNSKVFKLLDSLPVLSLLDSVGKITQNKKPLNADTLRIVDTGSTFDTNITSLYVKVHRKTAFNCNVSTGSLIFSPAAFLSIGIGKTITMLSYTVGDWNGDSLVSSTGMSYAYIALPSSITPANIYARGIGSKNYVLDLRNGGIDGGNDSNVWFHDPVTGDYMTPRSIGVTSITPGLLVLNPGDSATIIGHGFYAPCSLFVGGVYFASHLIDTTKITVSHWSAIRSLQLVVKAGGNQIAIDSSRNKIAWNGSVSSSWGNALNWTPAIVPGYYDTAYFHANTVNCNVLASINVKARIIDTTYTGIFNDGGNTVTVGLLDSIKIPKYLKLTGARVYTDSGCHVYTYEDVQTDSSKNSTVQFLDNASWNSQSTSKITRLSLTTGKIFNLSLVNGRGFYLTGPHFPLTLNHAKFSLLTSGQIYCHLTASDTFMNTDITDTFKSVAGVSSSIYLGLYGTITGYIRSAVFQFGSGVSIEYGVKNSSLGGTAGNHTYHFIGPFSVLSNPSFGGGDFSISGQWGGYKTKVYFDSALTMNAIGQANDGTLEWGCPAPTCSLEVNFGNAHHRLSYFSQAYGGGSQDSGYQKIFFDGCKIDLFGDWTYNRYAKIDVDPGTASLSFKHKAGSGVLFDSIKTYGNALPIIIDSMNSIHDTLILADKFSCSGVNIKTGNFINRDTLHVHGSFSALNSGDSVLNKKTINADSVFSCSGTAKFNTNPIIIKNCIPSVLNGNSVRIYYPTISPIAYPNSSTLTDTLGKAKTYAMTYGCLLGRDSIKIVGAAITGYSVSSTTGTISYNGGGTAGGGSMVVRAYANAGTDSASVTVTCTAATLNGNSVTYKRSAYKNFWIYARKIYRW